MRREVIIVLSLCFAFSLPGGASSRRLDAVTADANDLSPTNDARHKNAPVEEPKEETTDSTPTQETTENEEKHSIDSFSLETVSEFDTDAYPTTDEEKVFDVTESSQSSEDPELDEVTADPVDTTTESVLEESTEAFTMDPSVPSSTPSCPDVCLTKGCTKAAANTISYMNLSSNPCDDFFEFACGKFVEDAVIPEEKTSVNVFTALRDELLKQQRAIIEKPRDPKDSNVTTMVKDFYASCMNTTTVEKLGLTPLLNILDEHGGWPVLVGDKWNGSHFDWIKSVFKNRKLGYSIDYFIDFSLGTNIKNSSWRMIWFDQPPLGMSREYLVKGLNDSDVRAYLNYSIDMAVHLGADRTRAEKEMKEVLLFQMELANISLPREKMRNITKLYNVYTLKNLTEQVPEIPWLNYTNTLLAPVENVTEHENVSVSNMDFIKNFTKLINKTSKRVQANYLLFRMVSASVFLLPDLARDIQLEYWKKVSGVKKRNPRWKECISVVSSRLPLPVSHLYIQNYFDEGDKSKAEELVSYIKAEFRDILNKTTWMDNKTKIEAFKKADSMKHKIGYPKELKNGTLIQEIYEKLKITNGTFFENILSQNIYLTDVIFSRLRKKIDKEDWQKYAIAATVNAYYRFLENVILFPAGILQGIFYDTERPNYMNFGGIGFIIGHEITHAFDDKGKQFNSVGDLKNWWEPKTQKKYREKADCIVHQYGNYTDPENGINLNGINSQGENIADNGGIKEAYRAYHKWVAKNRQEPRLPGLQEFNQKQMFWISAAQIWCSKSRPEALKIQIETGVHSPGRFRVIGPLSNSEDFAQDWHCPLGSKMNPKKKCQVW